ncbi:DUF3099 domain-containing protein [Nocardioides currus]|uniref:DUF3099 domain-containing protein n=1 Tax=Nocardioides currus TaxID=2133958 RepID=A0A2R7YUJ0_9ACTN|nr:DUF3099 domain-containing protein [Nocardioides currus]PUA79963.1 hypothetical protein C7S10_15500 [Nocardioides currus]
MASRDDNSVRITTAPTSVADDIAGRQRRYLFSMAVRTACVIGAVAVGAGLLRWILVAGAVLLPYVAVVLANAGQRKDDGFDLRSSGSYRELE